MSNAIVAAPDPDNEPVRSYAPGSPEKASLQARLAEMMRERIEIPLIIGGEEILTGSTREVTAPHDHGHVLAVLHQAGTKEVEKAVAAAAGAWREWSEMDWESRAAVFLKAAELLAGPWRDTVNAATMLGQSKTVYQAEIDSACELIDFLRFNVSYMEQIYRQQPQSSTGLWNRAEYRALEGFVLAVTPFNFTAIAGNLPTSPAMMGNTVLWKPAETSSLSSYYVFRLLQEAGLPAGVINFVPGPGREVGPLLLPHRDLAGVHFTGSTPTFQSMWKTIADNIGGYRTYPRIVGETGGKNFIFAHPSADVPSLVTAMVRGAFEYQGQKCSAASRAYIPQSLWPRVRESLENELERIKMGSPLDFRNFMAAVIDRTSFEKIRGAIESALASSEYELVSGGGCDDSEGYFIEPTVLRTEDPSSFLMCEELFGPVLTVWVYRDAEVDEAVRLCDSTSPYGLTGAIFACDRGAIARLSRLLRHSAGNFYINDKPTGAVVGQQPFGGSRASGTNDKAGSWLNLLRWTSMRTIKETLVPPTEVAYPHMEEQ